MKFLSKILCAGAILASSIGMAHASNVDGTLSIDNVRGTTANQTSTGITFSAGATGYIADATGGFSVVGSDTVNFTSVVFANISTATPQQIFTFTDATLGTVTFKATAYSLGTSAFGTPQTMLTGQLYINGVAQNEYYLFTSNASGAAAFTSIVSQTPEPSSLLLMGTGLVSVAGFALRRRSLIS